MRCEEIRENLSALADGELDAEARAEVDRHLETCAACRDRLADYRGTWALLGRLADAEPGPGFLAAVRRRAGSARPGAAPRRWGIRAAAALAASALLVAGLMWLGRGGDAPRGPESPGVPPDVSPVPAAFVEVEAAVAEDPELLEILRNLETLEAIEILENLPLLERLEDIESAREADAIAEAAEHLVIDVDVPLAFGERD